MIIVSPQFLLLDAFWLILNVPKFLTQFFGCQSKSYRCRHGYFHVVNNDYTHWEMYAIGGSANPTINSQGNRYLAPANPFAKEVPKKKRAEFVTLMMTVIIYH